MDISKKKKQLVVNNVFLLSIFVLIIYSLGFIIRIGKHSLISNYLGFTIPAYINIALCLILLVLVIFVLLYNKNKINPKLSLIFVSIAIIYTIYLMLYGRLVSGISYNEILSNVKNIWMMSLLGFISLVIVPRIVTKKNINFILYFLILLSFISTIYFCIKDLPAILKDFLSDHSLWLSASFYTNKNTYGIILFLGVVSSLFIMNFNKKLRYLFISFYFVIFMVLAYAKTAFICALIIYLFLFMYGILHIKKTWKKVTILLSLAIVLIALGLIISDITPIKLPSNIKEYLSKLVYASKTLTSRIQEFVKSIAGLNYKNIYMGVGYESALALVKEYSGYDAFHTAYNQDLLSGGILMTILKLLAIIYILKCIHQIKPKNKASYILLLGTFVSYMFYSLCESILLFDWAFLSFAITLLVCAIPISSKYHLNIVNVLVKKESPKHIAFVTSIYPSNDKKWYGIYLHDYALAIKKLGYDISIIKISEEDKNDEVYEGINIHYVKYKNKFVHKLMLPLGIKFKLDLKATIETYDIDTAFIHFYPVAFQNVIIDYLHESNIKVIHYLHSRNIFKRIDEKHPLFRKIYLNPIYKKAYKKCDEIICVSELVKKDLLSKLPKYKNAHVIYNGCSDMFINTQPPKFVNKTNNFNIITVGNMYSIKGYRYIIEALHKIKEELPNINFKWTIVGNGIEYNQNIKLINDYNLTKNVKIIKELNQPQLLEKLKNNDIFIMPSFYEALGIVYLEAMNVGLITIGCTNQGISEIFDTKSMQFVDERNVTQIVLLLKNIFNNYASYECLRKNAKNVSKKFSWENAAKELEKYI